MKQHITPDQFKEMDELDAVKLFDLVPRKEWYKYHHKKVTIGKMMKILEQKDKRVLISRLVYYNHCLAHDYPCDLCDELWEEIKLVRIK